MYLKCIGLDTFCNSSSVVIQQTQFVRYLVVIYDNKLNWKNQIEHPYRKYMSSKCNESYFVLVYSSID